MESIFLAFTIGLFGSLHCFGMCGPIAFTLHAHLSKNATEHIFLYQFGRIVTYSIIGFFVGFLGLGLQIASSQQIVSILSGIFILMILTAQYFFRRKFKKIEFFYALSSYLNGAIKNFIQKQNAFSIFLVGVVNGLLPCGLVYLALAGAGSTANQYHGAIFMMVFGLGTLPAMLAAAFGGKFFTNKMKMISRRIVPLFTLSVAIILIVRGLNLGIPYLSPKIVQEEQCTLECCTPDTNN